MSDVSQTSSSLTPGRILRAIGPAIVVASVVLGPGSILINSKIGAAYGYQMVWLLGLSTLMMIGTVMLSAVIGVSFKSPPLVETRQRFGSWMAISVGLALFLITTGFQFSNNLAVMAVVGQIVSAFDGSDATAEACSSITIVLVNALLVAVLYGNDQPYKVVERMMMVMVGMMLVGFLFNLIFVQPSLIEIAKGIVPSLKPPLGPAGKIDFMLLSGLVGTTFSLGGAFYQAYGVREKGWTRDNVADGLVDSVVGIGVLGLISLMVMATSAAALRGVPLEGLGDIAQQLKPLLDSKATIMFGMGILAGAGSSLLVNALIGGTALADGLGFPSSMKDAWPKALTVACLMVGMFASIAMTWTSFSKVTMIVTAQALTVVGLPLLAVCVVALTFHLPSAKLKPLYLGVAFLTLIIALGLAARVVLSLLERLS